VRSLKTIGGPGGATDGPVSAMDRIGLETALAWIERDRPHEPATHLRGPCARGARACSAPRRGTPWVRVQNRPKALTHRGVGERLTARGYGREQLLVANARLSRTNRPGTTSRPQILRPAAASRHPWTQGHPDLQRSIPPSDKAMN
jgi:hypothetical protein